MTNEFHRAALQPISQVNRLVNTLIRFGKYRDRRKNNAGAHLNLVDIGIGARLSRDYLHMRHLSRKGILTDSKHHHHCAPPRSSVAVGRHRVRDGSE